MEPKGFKRNPFRGGVSQFIRCEAPSSLHPGIECRITSSLPQQVSLRLTPSSRAVRSVRPSEDGLEGGRALWIGEPFCGKEASKWGRNRRSLAETISAICKSTFAVGARCSWTAPFPRIRPRTTRPSGQIDLVQSFCPRPFWSSPMPPGYRSVSVWNGKA